MWDLKPHSPAEILRPFKPIATATPGLMICDNRPRLAEAVEPLCARGYR